MLVAKITTTVALGPHFDAFVQACVLGGRYTNASEVIRAGLRRLLSPLLVDDYSFQSTLITP
ncbi:MAG: type II toxin-antitoxin system ParD family antitoxin [Bacteroidales bacterium]|nr:type II toxin-antitoxin system ParD family antitoxin [Bacteroidales bacterium]